MHLSKKIPAFLLMASILVITLVGCGGGGGTSLTPEQQAVSDAFSGASINPESVLCDGFALVGISKPKASDWFWNTVDFSNLYLEKSLSNIMINDTTATAVGTITVTGSYRIDGTTSDGHGSWRKSNLFELTGSGTITFTKVNGNWQIDDIPGILLVTNNGKSPSINNITIPNSINQDVMYYIINATVISNNGSEFKSFYYDICGLASSPVYAGPESESPLNISRHVEVHYDVPTGTHYGSIAVLELVEKVPDSSYELYMSAYLTLIKVNAKQS